MLNGVAHDYILVLNHAYRGLKILRSDLCDAFMLTDVFQPAPIEMPMDKDHA